MAPVALNTQRRFNVPARHGRQDLVEQLRRLSASRPQSPFTALAVCAHPDDEALGPGATLARIARLTGLQTFVLLVAPASDLRSAESLNALATIGIARENVLFAALPDGRLDEHTDTLRALLRDVRDHLMPSLIITHRLDAHPDHAAIARATVNVFGHAVGTTILHFNVLQHLASPWRPNCYFRVEPTDWQRKRQSFDAYLSQAHKSYFDERIHEGWLRQAGVSAGSEFAEPFETYQLYLAGACPCGKAALAGQVEPTGWNGDGNGSVHDTPPFEVGKQATRLVLECCPHCDTVVLANGSNP